MDKNKFSEDETLDIQDPENNQDELDEEELDNEEDQDQDEPEDDQGSEDKEDDEDKDEPENKFEKAYKNQKARAEKAEAKLRELEEGRGNKKPAPTKKPSPVKAQELSPTDTYTLLRNNVHEDDVKDVVDFARLRGIPVSEALKSPLVRSIINDNESKRKTANVTNKGSEGRRGSYRVPVEVLLSNARKGIMPDNDADLDRLVDAQMAQRKNKNKK